MQSEIDNQDEQISILLQEEHDTFHDVYKWLLRRIIIQLLWLLVLYSSFRVFYPFLYHNTYYMVHFSNFSCYNKYPQT